MQTIKTIGFCGRTPNNPLNEVAYCVFSGNRIVFTAAHSEAEGPVDSTVNHAETIIEAIATVEKLDPKSCQFFDLLTSKQENRMRLGQYILYKLTLHWREKKIIFVHWGEVMAENDILDIFSHYIRDKDGRTPFQDMMGSSREAAM